MCFNPIIEYLETQKQQYGYDFAGQKLITTPYADDFNLITGNNRYHQKLVQEVDNFLSSMFLTVRAKKCRSLSISGGKPTVIDFSLAREQIASVQNNPIKFLGSHITFKMKTSETYDFIRHKVESTLTNIDGVNIKNEYELRIPNDYALSSMRYMTFMQLTLEN